MSSSDSGGRRTLRALNRLLAYLWPAPYSALGLLLAAIVVAVGGSLRRGDGTLECSGGLLGRCAARLPLQRQFVALTLGHVIVGVDPASLDALRAHEHVHVRQYERWGLLFVPAYLGSSLLQWLRGRDPYWGNRFEREARRLARAAVEPTEATRHG